MSRLRSQLERLSAEEFGGIVLGAMAVACADGSLEQNEINEMIDSLDQLTEGKFGRDAVVDLLNSAIDAVNSNGVDGAVSQAASMLSGDSFIAEVAVVVASAIGWSGRGIGASEGARIRRLSDELGIDEQTYFELLAEGKTIVGR